MKKTTYIYILVSLLLFTVPAAYGQEQASGTVNPEEVKPGLYNGLTISADLYGPVSNLFGSDHFSGEVSVAADFKNRFFPILELGYATTNSIHEDTEIHYKTSAPYFRIGMNYNTGAKKLSNSFLYVGVRYGFSSFKYDVVSPDITDGVWGGKVPLELYGESSSAQWLELLVGVQVEIIKNIMLGWAVRYKSPFTVKENEHSRPWQVPGMGRNKSTVYGISYSIIYKLPI